MKTDRPSLSLVAGLFTTSDGTSYYVTTDQSGNVKIDAAFASTPGTQVYRYSTGGDPQLNGAGHSGMESASVVAVAVTVAVTVAVAVAVALVFVVALAVVVVCFSSSLAEGSPDVERDANACGALCVKGHRMEYCHGRKESSTKAFMSLPGLRR
ncbi:hypothetical protein [Granulicella sp. S156]|uniref:hypothetical protein n=1 Tax=Granulicella sp. S156 TaxID=1747224 RepID=UPI00131E9147|nr:hypothetical protein [Granulicella sp. S156]